MLEIKPDMLRTILCYLSNPDSPLLQIILLAFGNYYSSLEFSSEYVALVGRGL